MPKKVYAVREGIKPGIYDTWAECQKHTKGYSGAEFKSFKTMPEAKAYMSGKVSDDYGLEDGMSVRAYVDGSYDHSSLRYAGGAVILYLDQELHISEAGNNETLVSMRNVAGELLGAIRSMEWFDENAAKVGATKLIIYYDYEGIAKWANGAWKAKKEGTQAYVAKVKNYQTKYQIEFVKVLAHSGDEYNDLADTLAKRALGLVD